jgi:hypothetical protein
MREFATLVLEYEIPSGSADRDAAILATLKHVDRIATAFGVRERKAA